MISAFLFSLFLTSNSVDIDPDNNNTIFRLLANYTEVYSYKKSEEIKETSFYIEFPNCNLLYNQPPKKLIGDLIPQLAKNYDI